MAPVWWTTPKFEKCRQLGTIAKNEFVHSTLPQLVLLLVFNQPYWSLHYAPLMSPLKKKIALSQASPCLSFLSLSTLQGFGCAKAHRIAAHTKWPGMRAWNFHSNFQKAFALMLPPWKSWEAVLKNVNPQVQQVLVQRTCNIAVVIGALD